MFWIIITVLALIMGGATLLAGAHAHGKHRADRIRRSMANHPAGRGRHGH